MFSLSFTAILVCVLFLYAYTYYLLGCVLSFALNRTISYHYW